MTRTYRVGIIGCGATSGHFLQGWRSAMDRAEVVALCDILPTQIDKQKEKWADVCGDAAAFTDYRQMLAETDLDICCLCAYGDTRLEHTEACLERGLHVFMEKPVGFDAAEARRFKFLAGKYPHLKTAVAYTLRYAGEWMSLRALIRNGTIGQVYTAQLTYCHAVHEGEQPAAADGSPRPVRLTDKAGNYVAPSQLVHDTHPWDMARYLFGEASEVFYAERPGTHMAMMWMRSGALVYVNAGLQPYCKVSTNTHQYALVHGTKGSAWFVKDMHPPYKTHVLYRTDGDTEPVPSVTDVPSSSHGAILRTKNFLDAIEGTDELICSMYDGALTTDLLHALWWSKRTQNKVPVFEEDHSG